MSHNIIAIIRFFLVLTSLSLGFSSCSASKSKKDDKAAITIDKTSSVFVPLAAKHPLSSMNIIDRNGLSETITSQDRLKTYQNVNFIAPHPYQKVLRVYGKDAEGNNQSIITSYHSNGQIKQYLEVVNGRAQGQYVEWHMNGKRKLFCRVIAGAADIDDKSTLTWSFDGTSFAWDEQGNISAEIPYEKGELNGTCRYFHPNGKLSQEVPYVAGSLHGTLHRWDQTGALLEEAHFFNGFQDGESLGFWKKDVPAWTERYVTGLLEEGKYYDKKGEFLSKVVNGTGQRALFDEASNRREMQQYVEGEPDGEVLVYENSDSQTNNTLLASYFIKNTLKHGPETRYYPPKPFSKNQEKPQPKLQVDWYEGKINGLVKTWYENGVQESQKEMSDNKKQGILMAWYHDGSVMLVEEYDKDRLTRGEYRKMGERAPSSRIDNGKGVATIYDADGHFAQKVSYKDGKPIDDATQ